MKKYLFYCICFFSLINVVNAQTDTVSVSIIKPANNIDLIMPVLDKYILKAKATKTDTNSVFTETYFTVGSEKIYAYPFGEYYVGEWTPSFHNNYDVSFTAKTSTNAIDSDMVSFAILPIASFLSVDAFTDAKVKFGGAGRTVYRTATLPNHLGEFDSLHAELNVICPTGDCDPWDRKAWIQAKGPDGKWIELIRYMTPYGTSCNHEIDLSDYLFMLEGNVEFKIFTDTWAGSWEYSLKLNYYAGTPEYKYGNAIPVYEGNYALGDYANLQPFEKFKYTFEDNVEKAQFNMLLSGHGWGQNNTNNAAEFYQITNKLFLNNDSINQSPWNDCSPNPDGCTGQAGTWYHNRAGWCPGAITYPFKYDLTSYLSSGEINIHYKYQEDYIDLCHSNHPNVSNVPNCDPNSGENPYYVLGTALLLHSNLQPFETKSRPINLSIDEKNTFDFSIYPNPVKEKLIIKYEVKELKKPYIILYDINGNKLKRYSTANILKANNELKIELKTFSNGIYFIDFYNGKTISTKKFIINK